MARSDFGGTVSDFVFSTVRFAGHDVLDLSPATLTFWSAKQGGTQYTDLLLDNVPVTSISVGEDGQIPLFQGPDGVVQLWADAGAGRVRMTTTDVVAIQAAAAQAANAGGGGGLAPTNTATKQGQPIVSGPGGTLIRYGTAPLDIVETFGAVGDGTTDNTTALNNAIAEQQTRGGGVLIAPAGIFGFRGELDISLGLRGAGAGQLTSAGGAQKRTVFLALDSTANMRCGPMTQGAFAGTANGGGYIGDFTIDGASLAGGGPLLNIGVVGGRDFGPVRVDNGGNTANASPMVLIWGAQNCTFRKWTVANGQNGGVVIDYGAGGNLFDNINTSRTSTGGVGSALTVTESQSSGAVGVYGAAGPSQNKFQHGIIERGQNSGEPLVKLLCSLNTVFDQMNFAAGSGANVASDLVYVGADVTGGAVDWEFRSCQFAGNVGFTTGIHAGTGLGSGNVQNNKFRNLITAIKQDGTSGLNIGYNQLVNVTTPLDKPFASRPAFFPMANLSTGTTLQVEQWVADTTAGGDGKFPVRGPAGGGSDHFVWTYPTGATPSSGGGQWTTVRKTTDQVVNNSITRVNDTQLTFPVAVGTYEVEGRLIYDGSTVAKLGVQWGGVTGVTASWTPDCVLSTATATSGSIQRNAYSYTNAVPMATAGVGTQMMAFPKGTFTFTTAGTLTLTWAQNNLDATDLTMRAGSMLRYMKVA